MSWDPDASQAAVNAALTPAEKVHLWREMMRIRIFEQVAIQHYQAGRMAGWLNVQIGQETIPVAIRSLMGPLDHSISFYRCLGHALASGMSMNACMAELFGKQTGTCKGKGGMHSFHSPETRFWGGYGSVATQTPLACGLAFGLKQRDEAGAIFCCLGDGAVNQGAFHESLNLAALFHLPVVFVIENNGYAMGTSVPRSSAFGDSLASRAEGYAMAWEVVDGNNLYGLRVALSAAHERARQKCEPTLLEVHTYRFEGHTIADANKLKYRQKVEVEDRQLNHDPITLWGSHLIDEKIAEAETLKGIREEAIHEATASASYAMSSPYPEPSDILRDVYWAVDHQTTTAVNGRHFFND